MIGIDIVKIKRLKKLIKNEKFMKRIFTPRELEYFSSIKFRLETIAGTFSAKEAVAKVFGTGIGPLSFTDIEIERDRMGKPNVILSKKAEKLAWNLGLRNFQVSISHEKEFAISSASAETFRPLEGLDFTSEYYLKKRKKEGHKGDFGKVALIGSSKGMAGSILLSSYAALRTGSGLVHTLVPGGVQGEILNWSLENIVHPIGAEEEFSDKDLEEILCLVKDMDAFALGPGMGEREEKLGLIKNLLDLDQAKLLDASGLNCLSKDISLLEGAKNLVITPHPLEFARLTKLSLEEILANPREIAKDFASRYNIVVVLKLANTIVTDGNKIYINHTGTNALATAGSGDVLSGIICSLLGQGYSLFDASSLGVIIHGLAGQLAARDLGEDAVIARDIIKNIGPAIKEKRKFDETNKPNMG